MDTNMLHQNKDAFVIPAEFRYSHTVHREAFGMKLRSERQCVDYYDVEGDGSETYTEFGEVEYYVNDQRVTSWNVVQVLKAGKWECKNIEIIAIL